MIPAPRAAGDRVSIAIDDRQAIDDLVDLHGHLTDDGELDRYDELFTADVVYGVVSVAGVCRIGRRKLVARRHPLGR
jgi:hypothetical protein